MWLLHSKQLRLEAYFDAAIPKYAILSHRWGDDEVSFQDLQAVVEGRPNDMVGDLADVRFLKIQKTRELAKEDSIDWVWIDTCCIDKKSSAELSEAINSMFRWYESAEVCYVHMADVTSRLSRYHEDQLTHPADQNDVGSFQKSDWFSRGWTLQELLAPTRVNFYNSEWAYIGERMNLAPQISQKTGIESRFLEGRHNLDEASIAQKMSWASRRQTTRAEDTAYCLLGLFGVNMPLLYGEGARAFMRLQLEIIRNSDDESIFAWRRRGPKMPWETTQEKNFRIQESIRLEKEWLPVTPRGFQLHSGLLAQEPLDFNLSGDVKWTRGMKFARRLPYDMTNQGLRFYVDAYPSEIRRLTHIGDPFDVVLNCYTDETGNKPVVITLMKDMAGYEQYWRRRDCTTFRGPVRRGVASGEEQVRREVAAGEGQVQTAFFIRQDGL